MSLFGNIMSKIFGHASAAPSADAAQAGDAAPSPAAGPSGSHIGGAAAAPGAAGSTAPAQNVDVGAVLGEMASKSGGGGNYQTSIVDLLKLLDLDSSLSARKELAQELNVHAGADGSAEQNIALHKAVMQKLAENGGKVPDSMKA